MSACESCGNRGAVLAPHTGSVLCDCCSTRLLIGPHECLSHQPAGTDKGCSQCGAGPEELMDCKVSTNVCMVCGWIMPAEGVPDSPDDLLGKP